MMGLCSSRPDAGGIRPRVPPIAGLVTAVVVVVATALALAAPARATDAGETIWTRTWGGSESQARYTLAQACPGGDVIVAGYITTSAARHIVVARYSPSGRRRWIRTIDDAGSYFDSPSGLAVDRFGNAVVVGSRQAAGSSDQDILAARITKGGRHAWRRVIDAGGPYDQACAVAVDRDGDAYAACVRPSAVGYASLTFRFRARNGDTIWMRELSGEHTLHFPADIAIDGNRNTYITGDGLGVGMDEMVSIKLSPRGSVRWTREVLAAGTYAAAGERIALAPGGVVYAAGTLRTGVHTSDMVLVKYRTNSDELWRDVWDASGAGAGMEHIADLAADRNGNVFVAGSYALWGPNPGRAFLARWKPNKTRWSVVRPDAGNTDTAFSGVVPDNAGGCYVAGGMTYNVHDADDAVEFGYYARFRSSGTLRWERGYGYVGGRTSFSGIATWPGSGLCLVGDARDPENHQGRALVQLRRR